MPSGYLDTKYLKEITNTIRERAGLADDTYIGIVEIYDDEGEINRFRQPVYDNNGNPVYTEEDGNTVLASTDVNRYISDYICKIPYPMDTRTVLCTLKLSTYDGSTRSIIIEYVTTDENGLCAASRVTAEIDGNSKSIINNAILYGSYIYIYPENENEKFNSISGSDTGLKVVNCRPDVAYFYITASDKTGRATIKFD